MEWQTRIKELLARNVSVGEIAASMGVTDNAVREVLSGRTKQPRADAAMGLIALCQKHQVTPEPKPEAA